MRNFSTGRTIASCIVILVIASSWSGALAQSTPTTKPYKAVPDQNLLHNGYIITPQVISGAQPEGEPSFKALQELGVKTIISVDGAKPDIEGAKKYGIRYVHIPITYSTVTPAQANAIAKAMVELPGPFYVHCHHGRHRSAAAVAVACVMTGQLKPEQAESVLQTFGTGANYTGLWKVARETRPVDVQTLRAMKIDFPEAVQVGAIADAMVSVDEHSDHLKQIQAAGWKAPADHPDLDPAHEALQLHEHLVEMGRTDATKAKPAAFAKLLTDSQEATKALQMLLAAKPINAETANATMTRVTASCTACHKAYRD